MEFNNNQNQYFQLTLIALLHGFIVSHCHLCLTWRIFRNNLYLTCKADDLQLTISFYDNLEDERGFCLLSYPVSSCHSHSENQYLNINLSTNETVMVIQGIAKRYIEGIWTCRHGTSYEYAIVNITNIGFRDVSDLSIRSSTIFPLINGLVTEMICSVTTKDAFPQLTWDCLNLTHLPTSVRDCKTYVSKLEYTASIVDNGKICKCSARIDEFVSTTEIAFKVQKAPNLQVKRVVECNLSKPVAMDCHVDGFSPRYGFSPWTHSVNGMVIRHISGLFRKEQNTSTLYIDPCKLDDIGTYTCNVITLDKRELIWTNSSTLFIKGRPLIIKTDINTTRDTVLTVQFYSVPEPTLVKWSTAKVLLPNVSQYSQHITLIDIKRPMYGKQVAVNGYMAQLIQSGESVHNSYSIFIENQLGNSSYHFIVKKDASGFSFLTIMLILTGSAIFIVTAVVTTLIIKTGQTKNVQRRFYPREIYQATPQINNVPNVYDGLRNQYLEVIDYPTIHRTTERGSDASTKDSERDDPTHSYEEISDLTLHEPSEQQESVLVGAENLDSPHYIEPE